MAWLESGFEWSGGDLRHGGEKIKLGLGDSYSVRCCTLNDMEEEDTLDDNVGRRYSR